MAPLEKSNASCERPPTWVIVSALIVVVSIGFGIQWANTNSSLSHKPTNPRHLEQLSVTTHPARAVCVYPNGATEETNTHIKAQSGFDLLIQVEQHPEWKDYPHKWSLYTIDGPLDLYQPLPVVSPCFRVFVLPQHRPFQWPALDLGKKQILRGLDLDGATITPIAKHPRAFILDGFIKPEEALAFKAWAVSDKNPNRMKVSTIGHIPADGKYTVDNTRTSENAWDLSSPEWEKVGRRIFDALRMTWDSGKYDGLQIVRYQTKQAYKWHKDAFVRGEEANFNWDSSTLTGSDRFATVFIYLEDVPEEAGGQTAFSRASDWISPFNRTEASDRGLESMKKLFDPKSWEYDLAGKCFSDDYLAVRPVAYSALLFYSQDGMTGAIDMDSEHAACPVVTDTEKWGANAWIWNNGRFRG